MEQPIEVLDAAGAAKLQEILTSAKECDLCGRPQDVNHPWCSQCRAEYSRAMGWPENRDAPPTPGAEYR